MDFNWLRVQHALVERMGLDKLPDLNAVLLLIGIQELGSIKESWTKEEKQDLMHIAICRLLSNDGLFEFEGFDADGWPHYKQLAHVAEKGQRDQELLLKKHAIQYLDEAFQ